MSRVRSWLAAPLGARLIGAALALAGVALLVIGLLALNGEDPGPPGAAPAPSAIPTGSPTPSPATPLPTTTGRPTTTAPTSPPRTTAPTTTRPAPPRAPLTVLNNSTIRGLGDQAAAAAQRRGWRVAQIGNFAGRLPVTTVYFTSGSAAEERAARAFADEFPQVKQVLPRYEGLPPTPAGIVLVVTRDWAD